YAARGACLRYFPWRRRGRAAAGVRRAGAGASGKADVSAREVSTGTGIHRYTRRTDSQSHNALPPGITHRARRSAVTGDLDAAHHNRAPRIATFPSFSRVL